MGCHPARLCIKCGRGVLSIWKVVSLGNQEDMTQPSLLGLEIVHTTALEQRNFYEKPKCQSVDSMRTHPGYLGVKEAITNYSRLCIIERTLVKHFEFQVNAMFLRVSHFWIWSCKNVICYSVKPIPPKNTMLQCQERDRSRRGSKYRRKRA